MDAPQLRFARKVEHLHAVRMPSYSTLFTSELVELGKHAVISKIHPSVDEIVARITAMQAIDAVLLDQLFYILTIAEEAVSRAAAKGVEVADLVSF